MILLIGLKHDECLRLVERELLSRKAKFVWLDQMALDGVQISWDYEHGCVTGRIEIEGTSFALEEFTAVYQRPESVDALGRVLSAPSNRCAEWLLLMENVDRWLDLTPARVITRDHTQSSNDSKPFQLELIRQAGLQVPETIVTNDVVRALEFRERFENVIYKSISGDRSIVRILNQQSADRLDQLQYCPVQFQEHIAGTDVRVHVVGDVCLGVEIVTPASDYRYATHDGFPPPDFACIELPLELRDKCVALSKMLELEFAGIDFRKTPDGNFVCLEANPMPGYAYYQENADVDVSAALVDLLMLPPVP